MLAHFVTVDERLGRMGKIVVDESRVCPQTTERVGWEREVSDGLGGGVIEYGDPRGSILPDVTDGGS